MRRMARKDFGTGSSVFRCDTSTDYVYKHCNQPSPYSNPPSQVRRIYLGFLSACLSAVSFLGRPVP
jgi:hypothetical protein